MSYDATFTVFQSPHIRLQEDNDYHLVTCISSISCGDILLIEHTFMDNWDNIRMRGMIRYNEDLFNSLYPRVEKWDEATMTAEDLPERLHDIIREKIQHNAFGDKPKDVLNIGKDISNFNHSKTPNAQVLQRTIVFPSFETEGEYITTMFLSVVAIKDIAVGEEICIKYNDTISFSTETGKEDIVVKHDELVDTHIRGIIEQYMTTSRFAEVMTVQYSVWKGLYLHTSALAPTRRFVEFVRMKYGRSVTNESIQWWLTFVYNVFRESLSLPGGDSR